MKDWLSRSQIRQRPMLAIYAGLLILIALAIGIITLLWLSSPNSDRLAVIANLLSFGTLLLALVAGIVALAAYSAATGLPNLRLRFIDPPAFPHEIRFVTDPPSHTASKPQGGLAPLDPEPEEIAIPGNDNIVKIAVENTTSYAARTPAVVIEFRGAAIRQNMYARSREWTPTEGRSGGHVGAVQWDGGPNYAIHGNSTRYLPELNLQGLYAYPELGKIRARMVVRLLADGYSRREITLDIHFVVKEKRGLVPLTLNTWL